MPDQLITQLSVDHSGINPLWQQRLEQWQFDLPLGTLEHNLYKLGVFHLSLF
jgi:hypothetical protein